MQCWVGGSILGELVLVGLELGCVRVGGPAGMSGPPKSASDLGCHTVPIGISTPSVKLPHDNISASPSSVTPPPGSPAGPPSGLASLLTCTSTGCDASGEDGETVTTHDRAQAAPGTSWDDAPQPFPVSPFNSCRAMHRLRPCSSYHHASTTAALLCLCVTVFGQS